MHGGRVRLFFAIAAVCALTSTVAGCTVGGGSSATSKNNTLVVEMWTNPPAVDFVNKLDAQFEKEHPGVKVKLQDAPTANNAWQTLTNSMLQARSVDVLAQYAPTPAGFPPASTKITPTGTAALITSHQLMDLTNQPFMKNYDASKQQWATGYQGHIYGVWAAAYNWAGSIWYKKDLLAKYHMKIPTTFDEFVSDLRTFASNGKTPIFVAGKDGLQVLTFDGILYQLMLQGHPAADSPTIGAQRATAFWNGRQSWTDPLYRETAARYEKVMKYIEPAAGGVSQLTAPGIWAAKTNDFPFFIDGSWDGDTIRTANPDLKYGFFTLPGTDSAAANRAIVAPDLTWVVPTWAKHSKLALEWLSLFSQPQNYAKWLRATGSFSTQPGQPATALPWMDWLNANQKAAIAQPQGVWLPAGAATDAGGPDLSKMAPFGSSSVDKALTSAATDYRRAVNNK